MIWNGIIQANALHIPLADESVHMCVTSPPYYGLREYQIEKTIWGGKPDCEHQWLDGDLDECLFCDAWLGTLGCEPEVDLFIEHMVWVFREVRRVLRTDGCCFMNLGDSYAGRLRQGYKPKDLMLIPHRVAIALQNDGWFVRNDLVWEKPACMPESVRDRCTRSHEYIFHMSKSPDYFYDNEAIKEKASDDTHARYARGRSSNNKNSDGGPGKQTIARSFEHMLEPQEEEIPPLVGAQPSSWKGSSFNKGKTGVNGNGRQQSEESRSTARAAGVNPKAAPSGSGIRNNESFSAAVKDVVGMRNKRTVWRIASGQGLSESHYAPYPPALIEPCILAGTSAYGCCSKCGVQYERQTEPSPEYAKHLGKSYHDHGADTAQGMMQMRGKNSQNKMRDETGNHCADYVTTGWKVSCECNAEVVPAICFDPFLGSGTTAMVCEELGRRWIGLDLGYQDLQKKRLKEVQRGLPLDR